MKINLLFPTLLLCFIQSAEAHNAYIENKGQIIDQFHTLNPSVLYLLNDRNINTQLRRTGFSYDVWHSGKTHATRFDPLADSMQPADLFFHRVDINFVNSSAAMRVSASGANSQLLNYYTEYTGTNGVCGIRSFDNVVYTNVWKGIDVSFELKDGHMKYNLIVHSGANIADIKLKISGANNIQQNGNGLSLSTSIMDIEETVPHSYYSFDNTKRTITARLKLLNDGIYGFETVDAIPAGASVIIDPVPAIQWSTYEGGPGEDNIISSIADDAGYIYNGGQTVSATNIATTGSYQNTINSNFDCMVSKYSPAGKLVWATYFGGNGSEVVHNMRMDNTGQYFYIAGGTSSATVIATPGAFQTTFGGFQDVMIEKFDTAGRRIWGSYLGGAQTDYAMTATLDDTGNVYIGGVLSSPGLGTAGVFQQVMDSFYDGFVAKIDSGGHNLNWCTYYGGNATEVIQKMAVKHDTLYTLGYTNSNRRITTPNAQKSLTSGNGDLFIGKLSLNGARYYSSYFGGSGNEYGYGLEVDDTNNLYIAAFTTSTDIPVQNAYQSKYGGIGNNGIDVYLACIGSDNNVKWGTYYGGKGAEYPYGMTRTQDGSIYVTGATNSDSNIATSNAHLSVYPGKYCAYAAQFNKTGQLVWGTYFDTSSIAQSFVVTKNNEKYITGYTSDTLSLATTGAWQHHYGGGSYDGFIMRLFSDCKSFATAGATATAVYAGQSIQLTSAAGLSHAWAGPTGFISTLQNPVRPSVSLADSGRYFVTIADTNHCTDTASVYITIIDTTTAVHDPTGDNTLRLYPNPVHSNVNICFNSTQQNIDISITDLNGRIIQRGHFTASANVQLDVRAMNTGMYFINVIADDKKQSLKFIKE